MYSILIQLFLILDIRVASLEFNLQTCSLVQSSTSFLPFIVNFHQNLLTPQVTNIFLALSQCGTPTSRLTMLLWQTVSLVKGRFIEICAQGRTVKIIAEGFEYTTLNIYAAKTELPEEHIASRWRGTNFLLNVLIICEFNIIPVSSIHGATYLIHDLSLQLHTWSRNKLTAFRKHQQTHWTQYSAYQKTYNKYAAVRLLP